MLNYLKLRLQTITQATHACALAPEVSPSTTGPSAYDLAIYVRCVGMCEKRYEPALLKLANIGRILLSQQPHQPPPHTKDNFLSPVADLQNDGHARSLYDSAQRLVLASEDSLVHLLLVSIYSGLSQIGELAAELQDIAFQVFGVQLKLPTQPELSVAEMELTMKSLVVYARLYTPELTLFQHIEFLYTLATRFNNWSTRHGMIPPLWYPEYLSSTLGVTFPYAIYTSMRGQARATYTPKELWCLVKQDPLFATDATTIIQEDVSAALTPTDAFFCDETFEDLLAPPEKEEEDSYASPMSPFMLDSPSPTYDDYSSY